MLDGTQDAGDDVELRRDDLAGLADLPVVRGITGIDGRAACTNGRITSLNFSEEPRVRPPEMMILAEVNSGRSEVDMAGLAAAPTVSTYAELPSPAEAAVRTVTTFLASVD